MSSEGPPDYGMPIPAFFLSDNKERTFQYDNSLPSLPVPPLDETLAKYLESVKPHLTREEFAQTQRTANIFRTGVGKELHRKLLEKAKHQKNWLEKWWEDYAYLSLRAPHAPYVNFSGPGPYSRKVWPPKEGTQAERTALISWYMLKFWEVLRKQKLRVDKGGKTTVWSMQQFYRMYNGCKTPGKTVDRLNDYFQTENEGSVATHLLVICRGRYFTVEAVDSAGHLITAPELELHLKHILSICDGQPFGSSVGALTGQNRTEWYQLREHLIGLHRDNLPNLDKIQKSIFAIVLDESSPTSVCEICREGLIGNSKLRWFDKTMQLVAFRNGLVASNCDHAPHDAMVNIVMSYFTYLSLDACDYQWLGPKTIRRLPTPTELHFHVDETITRGIDDAYKFHRLSDAAMDIVVTEFKSFGKNFIRHAKLHPDTFIQMALQLGYYRLHNKPAATYETASTRKFYHGRTETLRSCTMDSLNWTKAMLDPSTSNGKRRELLDRAIETHLKNMAEAQENRGCDRHLFGLQIVAVESGLPIPDLYLDKAYTRSGGGGNYILSTSCVGYTPVFGGVAPMCTNGYGFFYSIELDSVNIYVSCWTADQETSAQKLYDSVIQSLADMKNLVETVKLDAHL